LAYQPIENYGIIGNMHTAALVGMNGSIDWFCSPRFDSPSVFAAILDDRKGGRFRIAPADEGLTSEQLYWPDTNVLLTHFLSPEGAAEVADFMPMGIAADDPRRHQLIRRVSGLRGSLKMRMECFPALNYARTPHQLELTGQQACFRSPEQSLALNTPVPVHKLESGVAAEFIIHEDQQLIFALETTADAPGCGSSLSQEEANQLFLRTISYWQQWLAKSTYKGRWREQVERSALVLELLSYEPTGAVVAAATTSLPEQTGGSRNWDYRCSWIRDSAFTVYGLLRVGLTDEATRFINWIESRCHELEPNNSLQSVFGIDGRHELKEEILDHLEGYKGSRPVRIGNAAYQQLQMDIYGELMDSVYLYNKYVSPISYDLWSELRKLIGWVCDHWQNKDNGIWEMRGEPQHFVYSQLMCWVALDRAARMARNRSLPADRDRWLTCRDAIYETIMAKGWNPRRQAFTQYYGSDNLDAANLLMSMVFFMSPDDPKYLRTLDAISAPLSRDGLFSDGRVYRYRVEETDDGLSGAAEGTFNMCTFWLAEALTRSGRTDPERLHRARLIFEKALRQANHLGLYSEETGLRGEALGNFPQAFTHLGLISAAFNLNRTLG
jgi:GH15 family glucan-1,4-alpha-glucosidase